MEARNSDCSAYLPRRMPVATVSLWADKAAGALAARRTPPVSTAPERAGNAARGRLTASSPIRCGRTAAAVRPRPSFAAPEMARSPLGRSPRTLPNLRTGRAIAATSVRWP